MTQVMRSVRDVLNIKKGDTILCYGINDYSKSLIRNLSDTCPITALPLDKIEEEESLKLNVKTKDMKEIATVKRFDRVLCCYDEIPNSLRNFKRVMNECYNLCAFEGMILIRNLTEKAGVDYFVSMKHITKSWLLRNPDDTFDLLLKKEK